MPQLNVRVPTDEEMADLKQAADDAGMSVSEWARLVLRVASGRYELSEQLQRAQSAGVAVMTAAIGETLGKAQKRRGASRR